jgi:predicted amidohydrolase
MARLRIGLAQIAPRLGLLDENVAMHRRVIDEARDAGVDLLVCPELGLTGYLLQDLNAEVGISATDPRLMELGRAAGEMSVVLGFVE